MKRRTIIIGLLLLIISVTYAQRTPQDTLIAYYHKYPQQAIKKGDLLYQQAIESHNTPLLIKSLILKTTFTIVINNDEYPKVLNNLEQYISQEKDPIAKAILSSYCSQLYTQYYNSNSYIINQRTSLKDDIPEDIDSWSANLFTEKISKYATASLEPAEALQKTPLTAYKEILTSLTSTDSLRPTLYDFLSYRAMNIYSQTNTPDFREKTSHSAQFFAPAADFIHQVIPDNLAGQTSAILKIWQSLLKFRLENQNIPALLYSDLNRLEYVKKISYFPGIDSLYRTTLQELEKKYINTPYVIEVIATEANAYVQALFRLSYQPSTPRETLIAQKRKIIEFCEKGIRLYPQYKRINLLHAIISDMKAPELVLKIPSVLYPGDTTQLKLKSQNLKNATLQIYQIDLSTEAYEALKEPDKNTAQHKIYEKHIVLPNSLIQQDTFIQLPLLQAGLYKMVLNAAETQNSVSRPFIVTRLYSNYQANDRHQIYSVYDWQSGKPVKNAKISIYKPTYPGYTLLDTLHTNSRGIATFTQSLSKQNIAYQAIDQQNPNGPILSVYRWNTPPQTKTKTAIITDREIYRPGQIIYYKCISWRAEQDTIYALSDQKNKISFRDANNKEIAQQQMVSNTYGSFTGSFTIPQQTLNGRYFIKTSTGETSIEIAAYKRPEFEITFSHPTKIYHIGDKIHVQGKVNSFSGIKIANTEINYEISIFRPFNYYSPNEVNIQGITHSDANGNFIISFKAQEVPSSYFRNSYIYQIKTKATDTKGETEEASTYISVYSDKQSPTLQIPEQVNKMQATAFKILFQDINTDSIHRAVNFTIAKLAAPQELQLTTEIKDTVIEKVIIEGKLSILQQDSLFPDLTQYPSGIYLFTAEYNQTKAHKIFFVYSPQDHQPPYLTYQWIVKEKTKCYPGDTARIQFGTSVKDAYVKYDIFTSEKLIKQAYPIVSNEIINIDIPYKAEYGNQIWVYISYVKDKNFISEIIPIQRIHANRQLTIETKVFRDRLTPGENEEWKIRILDAEGKPVTAELLAMMYDASLDKISPYQLHFDPDYIQLSAPYSLAFPNNYTLMEYINLSGSIFKRPPYPIKKLNFSQLQTYTSTKSQYYFHSRAMGEAVVTGLAKSTPNNMTGSIGALQLSMEDASTSIPGVMTGNVNPRENFAETAFFYPQLQADAEGYVNFQFTVPETTTQWKFIALATTPELAVGKLSRTVTTSKSLMVRPNVPRFLRSGDQTILKVTISNLSDTLQEGKTALELFTPKNKKVIISQQQNFKIEPLGNQTLSFQIQVPENIDLLGYRVVAQSQYFSDGEQHLLPVLPSETLITQTLPIYSNQTGTQSYTLEPPSGMEKAYRLTFEMAANPIWYAVLAIPTLQDVQTDNITNLSAAYYINSITHRIIGDNPRIAETIRNWQVSAYDPSLLSKLEQNPELKAILLEASPWVMQAQTETERMQTLVQLFDQNRLNYLQQNTLKKLVELQNKNGGWSWFKGMYPSRFMTANVLTIMARANLTGHQTAGQNEKEMQIKALRYLDSEILKDYQDSLKKIHYDQITYLYVRSLYRDIPLGDALKAHKHFMALAQKQWGDFSLYEKALTVITLNRYGFIEEAKNILKSIRQYAVTKPDLGMYWPNNRRNTSTNSAIQVHTAIMEAFYELEGNTQDTELMKQWLLRQKQTQNWGNVPSTVDAIYALLLTGNSQLAQPEELTVQLGKQKIAPSTMSFPLGYMKETYMDTAIKPDMLTAKITKTTDSPSWGGIYLQYFEKFDQVQKQKGDLGIDKKLFIERITSDGRKELVPIEQQNLKTGDKIVIRLTLSLNRDMDFLYVKDLRAACFEPINPLSGNQWRFGTVYYEENKDAATNFFFNSLAKGTYVLEYSVWVNQAGTYQDGVAVFQNMYAPEYTAYSTAVKITVVN